ncbi:hypothetical protein BN439_3880 [Erwinia amylovora Ea644]|nr:hypothetical protein BN439_3880 [Erwinia amylovora Ea644]CCP08983.1 hypothetical protein BN440_3999 [Erwinia amylovora MR1]
MHWNTSTHAPGVLRIYFFPLAQTHLFHCWL